MSVVLDASALIAMIKGEKGSTKVAAGIAGARVSSVNYAEVVTHFIHAETPKREVNAMLDPLPLTVVPADKALAQNRWAARRRDGRGWPLPRRSPLSGPSPTRWAACLDQRPELEEACGCGRR